ncbi:MAG: hypothetical protein GC129_04465 [Proteobacteria bacterium]|nr:hypothetical protein [Pseudomonadota bacterium]
MGALWVLAALGSSIMTAQNVEMNRRAGQEGFRLNMWRMMLSAIFWLPLALLQNWPGEPMFYIAAIFGGAAMIVGFTITQDLAQKHNGRVAVLHMPLKAMAVFAVWFVLSAHAREHLMTQPLKIFGIAVCMVTMMVALLSFRRHDVSWSSLKAVLPIVVLYGAGDIMARLVVNRDLLSDQLVIYLFMVSLSSASFSAMLLPWRPKRELPLVTPSLMRAAGWAAFGSTLNQVLFFTALVLGPSPAYVSMLALLAPVWLLAYHKLAGVKDDASPLAGTVVVGVAIILMVLAA